MPKPVIFLQPHLKFGGAESQTVLLTREFLSRGSQVTVALHSATGGLVESLDRGVSLVGFGADGHFRLPLALFRAIRFFRDAPPSTVVVRLWSSVLVTAFVPRNVRNRHIWVFYEDLDPSDHVNFVRFGRFKQSLVGLIYRRRRNLVANTFHVAESMGQVYRLRRVPKVITCGVVPSGGAGFVGEGDFPAKDGLHILTVGSLIPRKGLRELRVALERCDRPIRWTLVGDGPLRSWLEQPSPGSPGLEIQVVNGTPEVAAYMDRADLLLHGALSESLGLVVLEALARGLPVIAVGARGPREIKERAQLSDEWLQLFPSDGAEQLVGVLAELPRRESGERRVPALGPFVLGTVVEDWLRYFEYLDAQ